MRAESAWFWVDALNPFCGSEMRDVRGDLGLTHLVWMTLVEKEYETLDPSDVRFFGERTVVSHSNSRADAVE